MQIIIKEHRYPNSAEIINAPDSTNAAQLVEKWQKKSLHYQVHGTLPAITWKVVESNNFIEAMIESTKV